MAYKTVTFMVAGTGVFPVDMLRYDACYPSTTDDAVALASNGKRHVALNHRSDQPVSHLKKFYPTTKRWESFGWSVLPESVKIDA